MTTRDDITKHPMWQAQIELERDMADYGVSRYKARVARAVAQGRETDTPPVKQLHGKLVQKLAEAIRQYCQKQATRRGRTEVAYAQALRHIDAEAAAFLALRAVLRSISPRARSYTDVAREIGKYIETELVLTSYAEQFSGMYKRDVQRLRESKATAGHAGRVAKHKARTKAMPLISWGKWDAVTELHVGVRCLELLIGSTGIVQATTIAHATRGTRTVRVLTAGADLLKWLDDGHLRAEALAPQYGPCVVPPKPWTAYTGGGYYSDAIRPLSVMAGGGSSHVSAAEYATLDLSAAYRALNYLQDVGWRLNSRVREVFSSLWLEVRGGLRPALAGLPAPAATDRWSLPPVPDNYAEMPDEERRAIRLARRNAYQGAAEQAMKVIAAERIEAMCNTYQSFPAFYYPHRCDFRGRMYPVTSGGLQPQGDDLSRGLLEFAEGKPLGGPEGERWLKIHTANCWGVDKVSYEERVAWVDENMEMLLAVARDPLGDLRWAEADDCWQGLAACFDLLGLATEGHAYVSHLPIRLDGTCNGIQHFSALARDAEGGAAVNLIDAEQPQDIYRLVADRVTARLRQAAMEGTEEGRQMAHLWMELVDGAVPRGLTKTAVMTMPYGATHQTRMKSVEAWLKETHGGAASLTPLQLSYMAKLIAEAIDGVVVAPSQVMGWLRKLAVQATRPAIFITPDGFPLRQAYYEKAVGVPIRSTNFMGEEFRLYPSALTRRLDKAAMRDAISANVVHSLDAAAMRLTMKGLAAEGITSFAAIHDSYGTHAAAVGIMNRVMRASFVKLYEGDVLADCHEALLAAAEGNEGFKDARPPRPGTLRMQDVMASRYFFA